MKTKQIKTSELIAASLDYAVAKCQGYLDFCTETEKMLKPSGDNWVWLCELHFSTDWSQGGPIIERENITITSFLESYVLPKEEQTTPGRLFWGTRKANLWTAYCEDVRLYQGEILSGIEETGPTPLIAAMRCYVASKLGETVDVPESLV